MARFAEIVEAKKSEGVTQRAMVAELSKRLGYEVSEQVFSGWKKGNLPELRTALELARMWGTSVDDLFGAESLPGGGCG